MKKLILSTLALLAASAVSLHAADAKALWDKNCKKCHGEDGKGQTVMGKKAGIKDYTDPKVQKELKDPEMTKAVKEGVKNKEGTVVMKPFGDTLSEADIKALVEYIRAFKAK